MTVLLALACTNGCSPNPATTDVQALPYDTGRYDTAALDHDDIDLYSGDWEIPDPAKVREIMEELPPASDGIGYQLIDVPEGEFALRPDHRSPLTAAAGCSALWSSCWDPLLRSAAACFANVPTCETEEPWEEEAYCCSDTCGARYAELRDQGLPVTSAVPEALFMPGSCMPGVTESMEDAR